MGGWTKASELNHNNRKGEIKVCACGCGQEFYCSPSQVAVRKYFSKECKSKGERRTVSVECLNCGNINQVRPYDASRGRGNFCKGGKCLTEYRRSLKPKVERKETLPVE